MENTHAGRWLTLLFFTFCGAVLFGSIFYLIKLPARQPEPQALAAASHEPAKPSSAPSGPFVLVKDKQHTHGNLALQYRGLDDGWIVIDVTILNLDPDYAYRHRISRETAMQGFQIAGLRLNLLAANRNILKIRLAGV